MRKQTKKKRKKKGQLSNISKFSSVSILHRLECLIFVLGASDWGVQSWDGQSCSNGMARDPKGRVTNAGRTET